MPGHQSYSSTYPSKYSSNRTPNFLAKTYPHIVFIEKKNEGVATTRNKALDIAHVEYIFFIDSDAVSYTHLDVYKRQWQWSRSFWNDYSMATSRVANDKNFIS